jgi:hypothetical protein
VPDSGPNETHCERLPHEPGEGATARPLEVEAFAQAPPKGPDTKGPRSRVAAWRLRGRLLGAVAAERTQRDGSGRRAPLRDSSEESYRETRMRLYSLPRTRAPGWVARGLRWGVDGFAYVSEDTEWMHTPSAQDPATFAFRIEDDGPVPIHCSRHSSRQLDLHRSAGTSAFRISPRSSAARNDRIREAL